MKGDTYSTKAKCSTRSSHFKKEMKHEELLTFKPHLPRESDNRSGWSNSVFSIRTMLCHHGMESCHSIADDPFCRSGDFRSDCVHNAREIIARVQGYTCASGMKVICCTSVYWIRVERMEWEGKRRGGRNAMEGEKTFRVRASDDDFNH